MSADGERRAEVLGRLRAGLAGGVPPNLAHPAPAPSSVAPEVRSTVVDPDDLVGSFARTAVEAGASVHRCAVDDVASVEAGVLDAIVAAAGASGALVVLSNDPDAWALGPALERAGCRVRPHDPATAASAALGVTGSSAAVAATGSVVLDSSVAGGRGASLLPPAHLCVVRASTVVAQTGDVLRRLGDRSGALPSNLLLVTGPSRTGDIEQILTVGVHGPAAVHLLVLDGA
jgi:L-lactate dehydrogenase complex protein LldG